MLRARCALALLAAAAVVGRAGADDCGADAAGQCGTGNCAALGEAFAPCNRGGCAVCRETPLPERPAGAARAMLTLQTGVDALSYAFSEGLKNDVGALTGISPARIQIVRITTKTTIPPSVEVIFDILPAFTADSEPDPSSALNSLTAAAAAGTTGDIAGFALMRVDVVARPEQTTETSAEEVVLTMMQIIILGSAIGGLLLLLCCTLLLRAWCCRKSHRQVTPESKYSPRGNSPAISPADDPFSGVGGVRRRSRPGTPIDEED